MESYECRCSIYNERCNKAAEVPPEQLPELMLHKQHNAQALEAKQHKGVESKKLWAHKKHSTKRKNLHKHKTTPATTTSTTSTTTTTTTTTTTVKPPTPTAAAAGGAPSNEEIEDDIIFRFVHENAAKAPSPIVRLQQAPLVGKQHVSKHEHHQKPNTFARKLSRLPTHYESFQTNPDSDILTFDDNNDWVASMQQQEYADAMAASQVGQTAAASSAEGDVANVDAEADVDASGFVFDESLFDANDGAEDYQRKQLAQDMKRIMSNTHTHMHTQKKENQQQQLQQQQKQQLPPVEPQYSEDYSDDELLTPVLKSEPAAPAAVLSTPQTHTDWSLLKKFDLSAEHQSQVQSVRKNFGACFAGTDSYFHYNDADTMSQVISYNIDLNLRIKTHSENGVILWTGRQGTTEEHDDYLSLGIENG